MKLLQPIESNLLQQLIDRVELVLMQPIETQIALAQDIQTPRSILQVLVDRAAASIAEIAKLHINYAGELTTDGREEIDAIFKTAQLRQNDRLAVELLKLGGVPAEFLSEWVPAKRLIDALKNPHLSMPDRIKFLARLAEDNKLEPRLEVAESIDTPPAILGQLLGDIELAIRLSTQHHPNCPMDVIELIDTQQSIANNWDTDPAELATLGKSHWSWIRLKVAQNPSSSAETLRELALDRIYKIQLAVANNPHTPAEVLEILLGNSEPEIQAAIAANPNANTETLLQLFPTQSIVISKLNNFSAEFIQKVFDRAIALDRIDEIRHILLKQPLTLTSVLAELSKCNLDVIRAKILARGYSSEHYLFGRSMEAATNYLADIAAHPNVSSDILKQLSQYNNPRLRLELAKHSKTPSNNRKESVSNSNNKEKPLLEVYRLLLDRHEYDNLKINNQVLSRRPNSPYFLAQVLKTGNLNDKIAAARNPNTPISILKQLAKDPDETIRSVISENKNLPLESLLELAEDSNINIRATLSRNLSRHQVPITLIERLATDEAERVRIQIASNSYTPLEILTRLTQDSSPDVCRALTGNPNVTENILEIIGVQRGIVQPYNTKTPANALVAAIDRILQGNYYDRDKQLNEILKPRNSQIPASKLSELANFPIEWVRSSVAFHQNTPASALTKLAYEDYAPIRAGVAENRNTPPQILMMLLRREKEHYPNQNYYGTICHNIAGRANIPSEVLFELARNESERIRQSIVQRPELPLSLLEWFVENEQNETVLRSLASRTDLTSDLLDRLAKNSSPQVLIAIIHHPNLTSQLWIKLAENESIELRSALARYELTPVDILELLSTDREAEVREKLAINQNTPANILDRLATDNELNVRIAIALNPNTSIDTLDRLAVDEKIEVRRAVSQNPQTSQSIKDKLRDLLPQSIVRSRSSTLCSLSRIYNPQTDELPIILSEYAQSENIFVRLITLRHPLTPIEILEQGMRSLEWFDRYAVADNPATPNHIRQQLTQDSNRIVRAISIANLR